MINRSHGLSLSRQAQLVGISRGSLYYQRKPPCKAQVQLMHRIDPCMPPPPRLQALACCAACSSAKANVWAVGMFAR